MKSLRVGLRARTTLAFAIGAFGVSLALVAITYFLAQTYLLRQRESLAERQTYLDARVVRDTLQASNSDVGEVIDALAGQAGSDILVNIDDRWFSSSLSIGEGVVPGPMQDVVRGGRVGRQRIDLDSVPTLIVGVPLPSAQASYYEVIPLRELDRTMKTLLATMIVAATITTLGGAAVGFVGSRRVLRPLRDVSTASAGIAQGELATRLDSREDPDLDLLVASFNNMASSLERRIEREARFASDVSHELRTPLTAMMNALQLVRSRAPELPERTQTALTILDSQVAYFQQLVLDLLEISRLDAGVEHANLAPVDIESLVRRTATRAGATPVVSIDPSVPDEVIVDERRLVQVLANLFDNAARYAGGATEVTVFVRDAALVLLVDDSGPGIPPHERSRVFERFHRGGSVTVPGLRKGTGLGLALAREHVALQGGSIMIDDSPTGGARFAISIPIAAP